MGTVTDVEYCDGEVIPTLILGDGSTLVTTILKGEGCDLSGIGFSHKEGFGVGTVDDSGYGDPITGMGIYLQILTSNPESIKVLISRLSEALDDLNESHNTESAL